MTGRPPALDLDREKKVQAACLAAVRDGLAASAHDCSDGGLAVALAECCLPGQLGADVALPPNPDLRLDAQLFGESASRIVLSASPDNARRIQDIAAREGAPISVLGEVRGDELTIRAEERVQVALKVSEMERIWREAIPSLMQQ